VVTLGAEGALWTDGADRVRVAAEPVGEVLDTTGAGDAFAAGLLAARLGGAAPPEALAAGCRLAATALVSSGGRPPPGALRPAPTRAAGGAARRR
jgi:ribokinase